MRERGLVEICGLLSLVVRGVGDVLLSLLG
jgi:hypothetical protein